METPRESWFYEGEERRGTFSPEAGRMLPVRPWNLDEELPETDGSREEGASFIIAAIGITLSLIAFFVILYGSVLPEETSRPAGEWGVPVDEKVLRELPAEPGALPKFLEEASSARSPLRA